MSQLKTKGLADKSVTPAKLGSGAATTGQVVTADGSGGATYSSTPVLSGPIVGTQSTTDNSTKAASTAYVTTAISNAIAGVNPAVAVQAATTSASDTSGLTYNNGVSGIGATLTGTTNTPLVFDGYTFTGLNQRALVKNDTQSPSGAFNGVYFLSQIQTAILPPILTRALDFDQPSDINNTGAIPVTNGTINLDTSWLLSSTVNTVGTDPLTFIKFSVNPTTIVTKDTNSNVAVNNLIEGYTTTATAAGTTTLTIASTFQQYFTGSTTQTVVLPSATTLTLGQAFMVVNNSTGVVTVQNNGAVTQQAMAGSFWAMFTVTNIGSANGTWNVIYSPLIPSTASGANTSSSINQTSHGFSVGNWLYYTGSAYALAKADVDSTSEVLGVVSAVADANNFTLVNVGQVTGLSGLTAGTTYYLSDITAGAITATAPTTSGHINKPLLASYSTTAGYAIQSRGFTIGAAGTLGVSSGGTGVATLSPYDIIVGGTTSTGPVQQVSGEGTAGLVLTSNGPSALPSWQATASVGFPLNPQVSPTLAPIAAATGSWASASGGSGPYAAICYIPYSGGIVGPTGAVIVGVGNPFANYLTIASYPTTFTSVQTTTGATSNSWLAITYNERRQQVLVTGAATSNFIFSNNAGATYTQGGGMAVSADWRGVCHSPELDMYVAVAGNGTNRFAFLTGAATAATSFTSSSTTGSTSVLRAVCWSPSLGLFVAVGTNCAFSSPDGNVWTSRTVPSIILSSVIWIPEKAIFVAVSSTTGTTAVTSVDGINWVSQTIPSGSYSGVSWAAELGLMSAVNSSNTLATSPDGVAWTAQTPGGAAPPATCLAWAPEFGRFLSSGISSGFVYSTFVKRFICP